MTGIKFSITIIILMLLGLLNPLQAGVSSNQTSFEARLEMPFVIVQHIPFSADIILEGNYPADTIMVLDICGEKEEVIFSAGSANIFKTLDGKTDFTVSGGGFSLSREVTPIPLWMSILPPLIAILFALVFREVFSALFTGLLVGTTILHYYAGSNIVMALFQGVFTIADTYILEALIERGHMSIIIFSMFIGGMVNLITQNGGMNGVVNVLSRYAGSAKSGQFITWLMGVIIFFDDYANTLVVGNTMRSVTDRLKVSREKLAYLVDSTAAPIASIAFVTTWIGAELSYIEDGISMIGIDENAYMVFFNSLAYSFY
ncbi:MAG TPA: hypothetical protein VK994_03340, partial [Bacteroidales bacterium]|nr:hypothetical protein [Bacteroidales bacterium]